MAGVSEYCVICLRAGKWNGEEPHVVRAESALEAAEVACGGPLAERGPAERLAAQVFEKQAEARKFFLRAI